MDKNKIGGQDGKTSGSWQRYKGAVAWWFKKILLILAITIVSIVAIFLGYKFYIFQRRKSLLKQIATLEAELET
jgi:hypothetical protein